jgi:hypothetical protein
MEPDTGTTNVVDLDEHRSARRPEEAVEVAGRRVYERLLAEARDEIADWLTRGV